MIKTVVRSGCGCGLGFSAGRCVRGAGCCGTVAVRGVLDGVGVVFGAGWLAVRCAVDVAVDVDVALLVMGSSLVGVAGLVAVTTGAGRTIVSATATLSSGMASDGIGAG